ncbi:hypothetical protein GEMRC1_012044 [Eukaryota sp. GEM-RC1]
MPQKKFLKTPAIRHHPPKCSYEVPIQPSETTSTSSSFSFGGSSDTRSQPSATTSTPSSFLFGGSSDTRSQPSATTSTPSLSFGQAPPLSFGQVSATTSTPSFSYGGSSGTGSPSSATTFTPSFPIFTSPKNSPVIAPVRQTPFKEFPHFVNVTPPSSSLESYSLKLDPSNVCQMFRKAQENAQLTDITLVFDEEEIEYHSSILSLFSSFLRSKVFHSTVLDDFSLFEQLLSDGSFFFDIVYSFYGESVACTSENFHLIRTIASTLKYEHLEDFIQQKLTYGFKNCEFILNPEVIFSTFINTAPRDVLLTYKMCKVQINSLLLIGHSSFFENLFCSAFQDSSLRIFEFNDEFPGVSVHHFLCLFETFCGKSSIIALSNVICFYQLAVDFRIDQFRDKCLKFLTNTKFSDSELFQLLQTANSRGLFSFIKTNLNIWVYSAFTGPGIPFPPHLYESLFTVFPKWFLVKCIVATATTTDIDPTELKTLLELIELDESECFDYYELISPLFEIGSFLEVLMNYTFDVFQNVWFL